MANPSPAATPAVPTPLEKRQSIPDLGDVSSLLSNTGALLSEYSSYLTNPAYSSYLASAKSDSGLQSSISEGLVSALGSSSAEEALSQYSKAVGSSGDSSSSSSGNSGSGDGSATLASFSAVGIAVISGTIAVLTSF